MLVDKPAGATSRYVVEGVRRSLGAARAGHAGTLDPAATGLLVVLLEEATKLSAWAMGFDKAYQAEVHFGVSTDTLDRDGQVVERVDVPAGTLTEARIEAALAGLVGAAEQVPPIYAAIKREGRSLMSRARAGEDVVAEPRAVVCHGLELLGWDPPVARLHVRCGKGYYVRSLARDLGAALGLPAHLSALRRTAVGAWRIEDAVPPEAVAPSHLLAIPGAIPGLAVEVFAEAEAEALRQGRQVAAAVAGARGIAVDAEGGPIAMVERAPGDRWRVVRGFRCGPAPARAPSAPKAHED